MLICVCDTNAVDIRALLSKLVRKFLVNVIIELEIKRSLCEVHNA